MYFYIICEKLIEINNSIKKNTKLTRFDLNYFSTMICVQGGEGCTHICKQRTSKDEVTCNYTYFVMNGFVTRPGYNTVPTRKLILGRDGKFKG